MTTIYLAGPDVFYPDRQNRRNALMTLCERFGFVGLYPGDNDVDPPNAKAIRTMNLELIHSADYMVANLNPFRGFEPDSGTVFEIGYATALNKTVIGYANDLRPMIERLREHQSLPDGQSKDNEECIIEDFDLPNNLMFGEIVTASSAEQAIETLYNHHNNTL